MTQLTATASPVPKFAVACGLVVALGSPVMAQPGIAARAVPAANAAGWHDGPVTVEFRCRDVAPCPAAVRVTNAGRQRVAVAGTGPDGDAVSTALDVDVDLEPPIVVMRPSASRTGQAAVRIEATATDMLSGVAWASCNGTPALIDGDRLYCDMALEPGDNAIIVQAMDRAGNSGSAGSLIARVGTPRRLQAVPRALTLLVGQEATLQVVDEFGNAHPDAAITVNDAAVLDVVGPRRVAARGPGEAVVELSWRGLRAAVTVTVMAGERLPMNTQRWAVPAGPDAELLNVIYTHEVAEVESILLKRLAHGRIVAAALGTEDDMPVVRWVQAPAIAPGERIVQTMGETFGGGLLRLESSGRPDAIVRVGRPDRDGGVPLWRLEASGRFGRMVQTWDGTVFVLDSPADGFPRIVVIDGRSGLVQARVPLPRSAQAGAGCRDLGWPRETPARFGDLFIPDGRELVFEIATVADDEAALGCRAPVKQTRLRIALLGIDGRGASRTTDLDEFVVPAGRPLASAELGYVVPDARGGTLAPFTVVMPDGRREHRIIRLQGDDRRQFTLPILGEFVVMDDVQPIYIQSGGSIAAFDPVSGEVAWHRRVSEGPVKILAGRPGGGVVAQGDGRWIQLDLSGERAEPDVPLPSSAPTPP